MSIKRMGDTWQAMCDHEDETTWRSQQPTEYLAYRSLYAHRRGCVIYALKTEIDPDDENHPMSVLGVWTYMLAEDYQLDMPDPLTVSSAAKFLDGLLTKVAQDEHQDFRLMAREIRKCRQHLESVLRDSQAPERGAPCPECSGRGLFVRLVREYGHWCEDPSCERVHLDTEDADVWRCPRDREHWWDVESYRKWIEERKGA